MPFCRRVNIATGAEMLTQFWPLASGATPPLEHVRVVRSLRVGPTPITMDKEAQSAPSALQTCKEMSRRVPPTPPPPPPIATGCLVFEILRSE